MAPYTFKLNLKNKTSKYEVKFLGSSNYPNLDGTTTLSPTPPLNVAAKTNKEMTISKGGGTDGLFTSLSFGVFNPQEVGSLDAFLAEFTVYCRMPASGGSVSEVFLIDSTGLQLNLFNTSTPRSAAAHYDGLIQSGNYFSFADYVTRYRINVQIQNKTLGFPNSSCDIFIAEQ